MIAALGGLLVKLGLSWLGNLLLDWDAKKTQAKVDEQKKAGATEQALDTTSATADTQERIAQAEAQADKTQQGVVDAARKGDF